MITIERDDAVYVLFADLSSLFVDEAHLVGIMRDVADGNAFVWTNDQASPFVLGLGHVL